MGPSSGSSRAGSSQRPCGPPPTAFFGTKELECNTAPPYTAPPLPMPSSPIFRPSSSLPCSAAQNYRPALWPSSEPALHCSYHLAAFQPTSMQPRRRTRSALPRISISRTSSTRMNAASKQSFPVIPSAAAPSPTAHRRQQLACSPASSGRRRVFGTPKGPKPHPPSVGLARGTPPSKSGAATPSPTWVREVCPPQSPVRWRPQQLPWPPLYLNFAIEVATIGHRSCLV